MIFFKMAFPRENGFTLEDRSFIKPVVGTRTEGIVRP